MDSKEVQWYPKNNVSSQFFSNHILPTNNPNQKINRTMQLIIIFPINFYIIAIKINK